MTVLAIDEAVRAAVHARSSPTLTVAMLVLTNLASPWLVIPLSMLVSLRLERRSRGDGWLFAGVVLGGEVCCVLLKLVFHRPRPAPFFGLATPPSYAFPSGHAFRSLFFYGTLACLGVRHAQERVARLAVWLAVVLVAVTVGFSRVYLGVHYPSDVLGGYALALAWLGLWRAWWRDNEARACRT